MFAFIFGFFCHHTVGTKELSGNLNESAEPFKQ